MDIWMFICMIFVGLAKFEFAMQLKIRFGAISKIHAEDDAERNTKAEEKCQKIDSFALKIFLVLYVLTVGFYYSCVRRS